MRFVIAVVEEFYDVATIPRVCRAMALSQVNEQV